MDMNRLLETATEAADVGRRTAEALEQGGTCNLDMCAVFLSGARSHEVVDGLRQVGLFAWYRTTGLWKGAYLISPPTRKQGNPRMRAAEEMSKVFVRAGYKSMVYYQMD